jgi:phenylpyruvate tautomerase PptA (4-oxalocrotonate tautomerase family)
MPFTVIRIQKGMTRNEKERIAMGVHNAMVECLNIPKDDLFQMFAEYTPEDFFFDKNFLGISRSDNLVVIQITMRRGRSDAMKEKLYAAIAENLGKAGNIKPNDIFIYITENDFSDWSVGKGKMSMKIIQQ